MEKYFELLHIFIRIVTLVRWEWLYNHALQPYIFFI